MEAKLAAGELLRGKNEEEERLQGLIDDFLQVTKEQRVYHNQTKKTQTSGGNDFDGGVFLLVLFRFLVHSVLFHFLSFHVNYFSLFVSHFNKKRESHSFGRQGNRNARKDDSR